MKSRLESTREPIRETVRDSVRPSGAVEVMGRNGKILSRKRGGNVDRFFVPPEVIPEGWTYEWKRETLLGMPDTAHMQNMSANGWSPVMAETHPGLFMPNDYKGPIRRDDMILMERPAELTEEARREEQQAAKALMQAQKEQLGYALPSGFSGEHRGVQPRVSQNYQPSDVAKPRLSIEN